MKRQVILELNIDPDHEKAKEASFCSTQQFARAVDEAIHMMGDHFILTMMDSVAVHDFKVRAIDYKPKKRKRK